MPHIEIVPKWLWLSIVAFAVVCGAFVSWQRRRRRVRLEREKLIHQKNVAAYQAWRQRGDAASGDR